jgi:type VI secretion system secreted protein Hcp
MAFFDYFLKLDGIEGDCVDPRHKGSIEVESWSCGMSHEEVSGRLKTNFQFIMRVNKASPALMMACGRSNFFGRGVLTCRSAELATQELLKITLSEVIVTGFQTASSDYKDTVATDSVTLTYATVEIQYHDLLPTGIFGRGVKVGWDFKGNRPMTTGEALTFPSRRRG